MKLPGLSFTLTEREKKLIKLAAVLLVFTLAYYYGIEPLQVKKALREQELLLLQQQKQQLQAQAAVVQKSLALEQQGRELEKRLPSSLAQADLLGQLRQLAQEHQVTLELVRLNSQQEEQTVAGVKVKSVQMALALSGSRQALRDFLADLEKLPRAVRVQAGELSTSEQGQRLDLNLVIYFLPPEV
ncbi:MULTISPECIES: type II secretion system protein GspM [unclassified Carboxydocella]|uniref:type II secretion system protein GspM n=1 Tax=unclassified Carboxydocella TaxID=2685367 RepID=UPI0009AE83B6|nr:MULTISPECIES: type II secretion system protein GspM [unclassified Carboxydocella]AVX29850.1 Tfp pilus assembly protein PilO [Carboxydocella thermautotrophica]GAW29085.1 hypothetical protein ULO1_16550 [Carboxydocella sp. ULO1]GAW31588.1 hypothetical protein JDF658_13530 [Carboxydocella sp. JDF658]